MDLLPRNEHPCSEAELKALVDYLDAQRDPMAARIRSGEFQMLMGRVYPLEQIGQLKHCWPTRPGPLKEIPWGTGYFRVADTQVFFQLNPNPESSDHEKRIRQMLTSLRQGQQLPAKIVIWFQPRPSPAWVIIVGNHTTAARFRHALEIGQPLELEVYRAMARVSLETQKIVNAFPKLLL